MKSRWTDSAVFKKNEGEFPLSGSAFAELLQAVLAKGKPFRFTAGGMSMSPFIKDGDRVTVSPIAGRRASLGDVVAVLHPETGKVVVHRIIRRTGRLFLIKGDNMVEADGLLPGEAVTGYVTRVERKGKRVWIGLGPMKYIIAFLSRTGLLLRFSLPVCRRFCNGRIEV